MNRTNYLEEAWLKHLSGEQAYTAPANLYLGLTSDDADETGGGTELAGNGYARIAITWAAVASSVLAASNAPEFTASGGSWTVKGRCIFDASTGGNMLYYDNLGSAETVADGQSYRANTISITAS